MKKFTTVIFATLSLAVTCSLLSDWALAQNQSTNRQGQRSPQSVTDDENLPEGTRALVWSDEYDSPDGPRPETNARIAVKLVVTKDNAVYRPTLEDGKNEPRVEPKKHLLAVTAERGQRRILSFWHQQR